MATSLAFNAQFYLSQNLDVAAAISRGQFASAEQHFNTYGRFEGRNPNQFFDVTYYLQANQDVAASLSNPLEHFLNFGAAEGRFANASIDAAIDTDNNNFANEFDADAYLAANPDLANAVGTGRAFQTAYQHFVLFGQFEGRPGTPAGGPFTNTGTAPGTGTTFTLTNGIDQFNGTALNDTFQGTTANLGAFDSINGGAGSNTLNLFGDLSAATTAGVTIQNIQTVNLTGNTDTVDATLFGASAQQIWQITDAGNIEGLTDGQTAGFRNVSSLSADVGFTGANGNVVLDNVGDGSAIYFEGANLRTATVSGSIEQASGATVVEVLDIHDHTSSGSTSQLIETLNVSLTTRTEVDLQGEFASLVTFNATGSTAGIIVDLSGYDDLASATFGGGIDDVTASISGTTDVVFNLGAGNDLFEIDGTGASGSGTSNSLTTVTLGAGNDTFTVTTALSNIVDASEDSFLDGLITITDFSAGADTLDISTVVSGVETLTNAEVGNITAATSLFAALGLAASYIDTDSNDAVAFNYGGDAYIFVNGGTDAASFDDGDGLIKLTGVNANDLSASNFITAQ